MRRAALVAIVLVLGVLLLLRENRERGARGDHREPLTLDDPASTAAPESVESQESPDEDALPAETDAVASGHVADEDGRPVAGIRLLAIPRDNVALWDAVDPFTPPGEGPEVPFAHTDADGAFAFADLQPGDYRLAIDERDWMLAEPAFFRADTPGPRVVGVRALSVDARVRDLATREWIARFTVGYRLPSDPAQERVGCGSDGLFRMRVRGRFQGPGQGVLCRVDAEGYLGATAWLSPRERADVWLVRAGEPRLTLRVAFEDGGPCEEDAQVFLWHLGQPVALAVTRAGAGSYRVTIPDGEWTVEFRPDRSLVFCKACTAKVEVAEGERREVFLELERGGDIVLARRGWDGRRWFVEVRGGRSIEPIVADGAVCELRHVTPGTYSLTVHDPPPGDDGEMIQAWQGEIEVTTGSRHELTIE
jgi:hypothetical protein